MNIKRLFISLVLGVGLGLLCQNTYAAYPNQTDMYVNDFENLLSGKNQETLRQTLEQFHADKDIHIVIVTVSSRTDYQAVNIPIEQFAKALFARWNVDGEKKKGGILVLLTKDDRQVRIQLGGGYGRRYNAKMQKIVDTTMLPYFKQERYEAGIVYGTQAIMQSVKWFWFELYSPIFLGGLIVLIPILFLLPWGRFTGRLTPYGENPAHYLYDKEDWDDDFVSGGDFSGFDDGDSGATGEW